MFKKRVGGKGNIMEVKVRERKLRVEFLQPCFAFSCMYIHAWLSAEGD